VTAVKVVKYLVIGMIIVLTVRVMPYMGALFKCCQAQILAPIRNQFISASSDFSRPSPLVRPTLLRYQISTGVSVTTLLHRGCGGKCAAAAGRRCRAFVRS